MEKINFINNQQPAINDTNLNKLQDNVEDAMKQEYTESDTDTYSCNYINKLQDNVEDAMKQEYTESDTDTYSCNYINSTIESGSNSNGNYIKYADGTMICYREVNFNIDITSTWGNLYYGVNSTQWYFAQEFISIPKVLIDLKPASNVGFFEINYEKPVLTTQYYSKLSMARPTSGSGIGANATILAIGRWK